MGGTAPAEHVTRPLFLTLSHCIRKSIKCYVKERYQETFDLMLKFNLFGPKIFEQIKIKV